MGRKMSDDDEVICDYVQDHILDGLPILERESNNMGVEWKGALKDDTNVRETLLSR